MRTSLGANRFTLALVAALMATSDLPGAAAGAEPKNSPPNGATASGQRSVEGAWEGILGGKIRFIVHLDRDAAGGWRATADSPDQNALGLAVDEVTVSADELRFAMRQLGGTYVGRFNADRTEINGTWKQGAAELPLILHPQAPGKAAAKPPGRPQEPVPPFPYDAIEVTYQSPSAKGVTLAGTLTVPKGAGPSPCAVLITGSGAQDRDETILGHKPFLVLADYLTRHGIAVLRSDDRGVGHSTGSTESATSDDFAGDVAAAVAFLKSRKEIAPDKIGLIGHSEGGLIAPLVATRDKSVAFVVMLAGPGVPGDSVLITQSLLISRAMGRSDSLARSTQAVQRELVLAAKTLPDTEQLTAKIREALRLQQAQAPKEQQASEEKLTEIAGQQARVMRSPWMQFFLAYDPRPTLAKLQCPVLALNGEKDSQVSAEQNIPEIRAALRQGGNRDATAEALPGLNHLFQTAQTGAFSEYAKIEETFAPAAMQKISDWIGSRMGRGK